MFVWFLLAVVLATKEAVFKRALNSPDHIIPIKSGSFIDFAGPRDYFSVVVFTLTDPSHGCEFCTGPLPNLLGDAVHYWYKEHVDKEKLVFAVVDMGDESNHGLIEAMGMKDVPHIWMFGPNEDASPDDAYGILREAHYEWRVPADKQLVSFAAFVTKMTGITLKVPEPFDMLKFLKIFLFTFVPIVVIKKRGAKLVPGAKRKHGWTVFSILFMLACLGGYQFTIQQGVPFVAHNDKGVILISGGIHWQFGAEILISAGTYLALAANLVALIAVGNYKGTGLSDTSRALICIALTGLLYLLSSMLTSIFLRKDGSYPFGYLKLF